MRHDIQCLLRSARKHKRSVVFIIISLGLSIGISASILSVADALLLRPLPGGDMDRLVYIGGLADPPDQDAVAWWSQAASLQGLAKFESGSVNLTSSEHSERVRVTTVSPEFFRILKVKPEIGRLFDAHEFTGGSQAVALLSHQYWKDRYSGMSGVTGSQVRLNDVKYSVAGVLPDGFSFPDATQIWIPRVGNSGASVTLDSNSGKTLPTFGSGGTWMARLRPGIAMSAAREELRALQRALHEIYTGRTGTHFGDVLDVYPLRERMGFAYRPAVLALAVGSACVLLIACVNATMLLLGVAFARQKEVATRLALGATPVRILRQWMTECMALTLTSAVAGFALSVWSTAALRSFIVGYAPAVARIKGLTLESFAAALGLGLAIGLGVACIVALQVIGPSITHHLNNLGQTPLGRHSRRVRQWLIVPQVALSLVLIVAAGLSLQTFMHLAHVDPGFRADGVYSGRLTSPGRLTSHDRDLPNETSIARQREIVMSLEGVRGLTHVALASRLPLSPPGASYLSVATGAEYLMANSTAVSEKYFPALGIPLRSGRLFGHGDADVVIVNATMARQVWPNETAVGRLIRIEGEAWAREVVGVVGDVKSNNLADNPEAQLYLPIWRPFRNTLQGTSCNVVFRCGAACQGLLPLVRDTAQRIIGPDGLADLFPLADVTDLSVAPVKTRSVLIGVYASLAVVLAVVGVFALVAYVAEMRRFEAGIRKVLGATRLDIVMLLMHEGLRPAAWGVTLGAVGAFYLVRLMESLLWGVKATDGITFGLGAGILLLLAGCAAVIPAIRGSAAEPGDVIRHT